jgi:hypothetical protein
MKIEEKPYFIDRMNMWSSGTIIFLCSQNMSDYLLYASHDVKEFPLEYIFNDLKSLKNKILNNYIQKINHEK